MDSSAQEARAPRTALMKLLDSLIEKRVIFLHAPAGFGKTLSTQIWLNHRETIEKTRFALISLDEYDNIDSGFCRRFVSALASLAPDNHTLGELAITPALSAAADGEDLMMTGNVIVVNGSGGDDAEVTPTSVPGVYQFTRQADEIGEEILWRGDDIQRQQHHG